MTFKDMPPALKYAFISSSSIISYKQWQDVQPYLLQLKVAHTLRAILEARLPYFLRQRPYDDRYPWVTYRCRHIIEKGQAKFVDMDDTSSCYWMEELT